MPYNKSDIGYLRIVTVGGKENGFGIWFNTNRHNDQYLSLANPSFTEEANKILLNLKNKAMVQKPQAEEEFRLCGVLNHCPPNMTIVHD